MEVHRKQIWMADLGQNEGSEQRGIRPVLILQNDVGNHYSPTVIVASITDARKRYMPTHVNVTRKDSSLQKDSVIMLEQIRTIDKSKLRKCVATLPEHIMWDVEQKINISLGMSAGERGEQNVDTRTDVG